MITLFAILYMTAALPTQQSLELSLKTFETREGCLRYRDSETFSALWDGIEKKFLKGVPEYKVTFGCAAEEKL